MAEYGNQTIRRVTPDGIVNTLAGLAGAPGSDDGAGMAARFHGPLGIAVDAANCVYVADTANGTIRKGWLATLRVPALRPPLILPDGSVQLNLSAITGCSYTIQASTNLVDWVTVSHFVATNSPSLVPDAAAMGVHSRFYRAVAR